MSESNADESPPGIIVHKLTQRRTFKACRTCRLQKSRCVGAEDPPCKRCRATDRDCVFEEVNSSRKRKRPQSSGADIEAEEDTRELEGRNGKHQRYRELEEEVNRLRWVVNGVHGQESPTSRPSPSHSHDRAPSQRPSPLELHPTADRTGSQASLLNEDEEPSRSEFFRNLDAPITAVHAMSVAGSPPSPPPIQGQGSELISRGTKNPVSVQSNDRPHYDDVVATNALSELEARKFFQLFIANSNLFLPLFDPVVDSFEAVRQRSTFCFTVIIAIALRAGHIHAMSENHARQSETCFREAQGLSAKSLFASSATLETIQAMILLAAYSERNSFAVSHAYQMSQEMGLPDLLPRKGGLTRPEAKIPERPSKGFVRELRTALILHQVDQEVATGTGRQPRGRPVEEEFLRAFLRTRWSSVMDIRIVANVELTQLRARLLREVETRGSFIGTVREWSDQVNSEIKNWFEHWDAEYQDHGFDVTSFPRSSLRLQKDYAFVIVGSATISKLVKEMATESTSDFMTDEMNDVVDATLERCIQILNFIADTNVYKWYLQWAPTYSALFPAFTAALAFRFAKLRPQAADWPRMQSLMKTVADILEPYPCPIFARIIRDLSILISRIINPPQRVQENSFESLQTRANGVGNRHDVPELQRIRQSHELLSPRPTGEASHQTFGDGFDLPSANHVDWISAPLSQFMFNEDGMNTEHIDLQGSMNMPDFAFDFNSFAASIQARMDDMGPG